jgi:hypothetical protein
MASNGGADVDTGLRLEEFDRLELALRRLFDALEAQRRRAQQGEARIRELEAALQGVSTGTLDPMELGERVRELEVENRALRVRVHDAEALVQRIQARLQFMEDER